MVNLKSKTELDYMRRIGQMVGQVLDELGERIRPGQKYIEPFGYGVVKEFVGHAIGRALHMEPGLSLCAPVWGQVVE